MTVKDVLVHVDNSECCKQRVFDAMALAKLNDAHLSAVYTYQTVIVPTLHTGIGAAHIFTELEMHNQDRAQEAKELFNQWTQSWRSKTSWVTHYGDPGSVIASHAAHHDIVVMSQHYDPGDESVSGKNVDKVVIECGRPVLVIPRIGAKDNIGKRILIAWNGSREAVRAVHDALPFLIEAEAVELVTINESKEIDIPSIDIVEHLSRHGVNIEGGNVDTKSSHIGEAILYLAQNFASDLIVMGAYGHSRFREYLLGGATRHVLEKTNIPILMSH